MVENNLLRHAIIKHLKLEKRSPNFLYFQVLSTLDLFIFFQLPTIFEYLYNNKL